MQTVRLSYTMFFFTLLSRYFAFLHSDSFIVVNLMITSIKIVF